MKAKELRDMTMEELQVKYKDFRQELFNLKFQAVTGHLSNKVKIRELKRDIARILTVVSEKERMEANKEKGDN